MPILAYNIINVAPPQSSLPTRLYVPPSEFSAQMDALKANGWHAITLDQLQANWTRGVSLGAGKPIVITFDSGYASHFVNALPVLKRVGWVGVENLQVNGLSAVDGGLTDTQVRGLVSAGWQLGTQGMNQTDLTTLGSSEIQTQVTSARTSLQSRYGVQIGWFSYPTGSYDPTVTAAVKAAGYTGATTTVSGWASPRADRFRLPRIEVAPGTSPSSLLSQISAAQQSTTTPPVSHGTP